MNFWMLSSWFMSLMRWGFHTLKAYLRRGLTKDEVYRASGGDQVENWWWVVVIIFLALLAITLMWVDQLRWDRQLCLRQGIWKMTSSGWFIILCNLVQTAILIFPFHHFTVEFTFIMCYVSPQSIFIQAVVNRQYTLKWSSLTPYSQDFFSSYSLTYGYMYHYSDNH